MSCPFTLDAGFYLLSGVDLDGTACPLENNEALARALWQCHKGELLADRRHPGRRPWAFWRFDIGIEAPRDEAAFLLEHGLLAEWEREALQAREAIDNLTTDH